MIAVTKTFPASVIREAYLLGMRNFGESYIQEFSEKSLELEDLVDATFHMIGHLQSNKSKRASDLFQVIHAVDTEKLARRLGETGRPLDVFLEVKLSPEATKTGVAPEDLAALIDTVRTQTSLRLLGLMTMPPWSEKAGTARPYFQQLRRLGEEHQLPCLSMGMSNDFEVAIEEGSTHIRLGTALFGRRPRKLQETV